MSDQPLPAYPRPNMQRECWRNLNGPWRFTFDPDLVGEQERWYAGLGRKTLTPHTVSSHGKEKPLTITVPFPWESPLSGVAREHKGAGWYEREITVPADWEGLTPFLNFGAVDWHARVWINGQFAAEHDHGYLPFSIDLTPFAQPGATVTVTVRAFDIADAATMVGKQVPRWYTYSSGIWQTVWLEGRAPTHVEKLRITAEVARAQATIDATLHVAADGLYRIRVQAQDAAFPPLDETVELAAGLTTWRGTIDVPEPRLWSPETPVLYDFTLEIAPADGGQPDRLESYFGMRTIARGPWHANSYEYILLNGEPVYLRGALDQAFHPDSLHAYPSDDVIRGDIQLAKDLGLNMLRCHIKINDPRYYYWADRLGLLIMYDIPSPDLDTPAMRRMFEAALPRIMARDINSPSIFAWVLFNETWGLTQHQTVESQQWVQRMLHTARGLDPTRLVEDNSPCHFNHVESDINSWHFYINDYAQVRRHVQQVVDETYAGSSYNYVGGDFVQSTAPLMNSEYGGIGARDGDQDIAWCFKYQTNELRRHAKICGYVYTELDDIEWEHNGFVNYDRTPKAFGYDFFVPGMSVADLNAANYVGLDAPPCQTLSAGAQLTVPVFTSLWGTPLDAPRLVWQLAFTDRLGQSRTVDHGVLPVTAQRFAVTNAGLIESKLPAAPGLATLAVRLEAEDGTIACRNYVNVEVRPIQRLAIEARDDGWAVRLTPGQITGTSWPKPSIPADGSKFSAQGSGWVDYQLSLPPELDPAAIRSVRVLLEAAARAGQHKVDWPQRTYGRNYPQTEPGKKFPSQVSVTLNGVDVATLTLPDDPADARGVLSHHHGIDPGAYGFLNEITISGKLLEAVRANGGGNWRMRFAATAGGLTLFGETTGAYPLAPTLILHT